MTSKYSPTDWFDVYYHYLEGCKTFNELNDLPEKGWEWHHSLPQHIFGDTPVGVWLTKSQHAIATAYQTLAFNRNFLCRWHLKLLPAPIYEIVLPLYSAHCKSLGSQYGSKGGKTQPREVKQANGRKSGLICRDCELGVFDRNNLKKVEKGRSKGGQKGGLTTSNQKWMSLHDGFISNAGCVALHNIHLGVDPTLKVKVSEEA